jgi:YVTN family beta-propeller protein
LPGVNAGTVARRYVGRWATKAIRMRCRDWRRWRARSGRAPAAALAMLMLPGLAGAEPFAYVPSSASPDLSVIDTATHAVVATVPLGAPASGVAIDRAGQRVYLAGGDRLTILDASTNAIVATVPIERAFGVAVNPSGTRAYVTREHGGGQSRPIAVVDTASATVVAAISMGATNLFTSGTVLDASGDTLFVAAMDVFGNAGVTIIDTANNRGAGGIGFTAKWPYGMALSPDGAKLYAACQGIGGPRDHYRGTYVIDVASRRVVGSLSTLVDPIAAIGVAPYAVATEPSGRRVYLTTADGLWVFDAATNALVARVPGGDLRGVAVHPDGRHVYAANPGSNSVNVYDTATLRLVTSIGVGRAPVALGMFIGPAAPTPAAQPTEVPTMATSVLAAAACLVALLGMGALSNRARGRR